MTLDASLVQLQIVRPIAIRDGRAELRRTPALPRPHDPEDRVTIAVLGRWELRDFAAGSSFALFFARHQIEHRQLLDAELGISVLTPSPLTGEQFELCDANGVRFRTIRERALREHVRARYGVELPGGVTLRALVRWWRAQ
jgi:hypothetical protein